MARTMLGFRKHLSTQDVMLQLQELVVKATRNSPRAILALDLKGAFENITHASILTNPNGTKCGAHTIRYIKNFLSSRMAQISVGNQKSEPIELNVAPLKGLSYHHFSLVWLSYPCYAS